MAEYIRYAALEKDLVFDRKFEDIYQAIMLLLKELKKLKNKDENQ